jgi:uroporphyrinogen-III synthase
MAVHPTPLLLLTRPRAASERVAAGVTGVEVAICPLMEIVGTGAAVDLDGIAGLILTSQNALPFIPRADLPAYCVGPQTAEAAARAGFDARVTGPDADGLVAALIAARPKGRLLHCHGAHLRGDIAGRLAEAGLPVAAVAVYDQVTVPPGADFAAAIARPGLIVPLYSPRSARVFAEAAGGLPPDAIVLALSPAVAAALPAPMRAQAQVLPHPDGTAMDAALGAVLAARNSP